MHLHMFVKKNGLQHVYSWVLDSSVQFNRYFILIFWIATLKVSLPNVREDFLTVFLKAELNFRLKGIMNFEILKKGRFQHNLSCGIIPTFSLSSGLRTLILWAFIHFAWSKPFYMNERETGYSTNVSSLTKLNPAEDLMFFLMWNLYQTCNSSPGQEKNPIWQF